MGNMGGTQFHDAGSRDYSGFHNPYSSEEPGYPREELRPPRNNVIKELRHLPSVTAHGDCHEVRRLVAEFASATDRQYWMNQFPLCFRPVRPGDFA